MKIKELPTTTIEAVRASIPLWRWLAKTGREGKLAWPGWRRYSRLPVGLCFLCEIRPRSCKNCPLWRCFDIDQPFEKWRTTHEYEFARPSDLRRRARAVYNQLRRVLRKLEKEEAAK